MNEHLLWCQLCGHTLRPGHICPQATRTYPLQPYADAVAAKIDNDLTTQEGAC